MSRIYGITENLYIRTYTERLIRSCTEQKLLVGDEAKFVGDWFDRQPL